MGLRRRSCKKMRVNKIKMTKLFIAFLFFGMVACGQSTKADDKKQETEKGWNTFSQANYSITYPSTWNLNQSGEMGTSFILFSPQATQNKFRENINLLIQDLSGKNIDLNKYTQISEEQIKTLATNSVLIESKDVTSKSIKYHKIIYTSDQGIYHLKFEQYYWVLDEKAYILTFTTEQVKFDAVKETGEKIMNSFILNNK